MDTLTRDDYTEIPLATADADEIYDAVRSHAWAIYPHLPTLVSVGRLGSYDGAWDPDRRPGKDGYLPVRCDLTGKAAVQETAKLARLVTAYAAHPDADPLLISQPHNDRFPTCVDLYLG